MHPIIRSKSPLRLGLAGGGTDVSPYADLYGGAILNATINLYAQTSIELTGGNQIKFSSVDRDEQDSFAVGEAVEATGTNALAKGVYNRIKKDYGIPDGGFELMTHVDVPVGSGLGTSSSLVVSILAAFVQWLKLPLGEYEIAHLAYDIERNDLGMAGGRQDQYAAAFGGVNFMEFYAGDKVIVNPLRIKPEHLYELENNLVLYFTAATRLSSDIIKQQSANVTRNDQRSLEAMHGVKAQAVQMKEALLRGRINDIGEIMDEGYQHKKNMAAGIASPFMDEIYEAAKNAGSTGGKISGAGGGGFMAFYCPGNTKYAVVKSLNKFSGFVQPYQFTISGYKGWEA